jgi:hypothetical protein
MSSNYKGPFILSARTSGVSARGPERTQVYVTRYDDVDVRIDKYGNDCVLCSAPILRNANRVAVADPERFEGGGEFLSSGKIFGKKYLFIRPKVDDPF